MFRKRLLLLALAASLGLVGGCSFSTSFGFGFPRLRGGCGGGVPAGDCCPGGGVIDEGYGAGASPVTEGPMLPPAEGGDPNLPVAPMPRLVPSPQHAAPAPYAPSSLKAGNKVTR